MINPSIKNMAETDVLQIPEALYQRLAIATGATQRSPNKTQKVSSSMTKLKSFIL
jgi:hypothetical protein